ncbi:unnamed protein product [Acanthoscelides obtectus]|uniref:Transposase Helix-turn-helix domain-containing protein n=1 Tax=Acanthoscelides obtectus TaxID=200917 RepID=A0A9P0M5W5_ACAOB|nr:unnamed protein product [Acanthoscelides obtectus]CAK1677784.1 hypothetical protein AOBTE_LOCUS31556 [Acanthoscelides obtectus]
MDDSAAALMVSALAYYNLVNITIRNRLNKKRPRRWWVTQIHLSRTSLSMQSQLGELIAEPSGEFKKFTRMSTTDFEFLLNKISPLISKKDTQLRKAVPTRMRLAITLRYLATGDSFQSLHFLFNVSPQLISTIVPEVCKALNQVLRKEIQIPLKNGWKSKKDSAQNFLQPLVQ